MKRLREEREISQAAMVKGTKVSRSTISRLENGHLESDTRTLRKVAEFLGVDVGLLLSAGTKC